MGSDGDVVECQGGHDSLNVSTRSCDRELRRAERLEHCLKWCRASFVDQNTIPDRHSATEILIEVSQSAVVLTRSTLVSTRTQGKPLSELLARCLLEADDAV